MNRKTATTAAALLLLAGVAAVAIPSFTKDRNAPPASAPAFASAPANTGGTNTTGADAGGAAAAARVKARNAATARLTEKYGDSRTKLASHLSSEVTGLAEDLISIIDLAGNSGLGEAMFNDPTQALGPAAEAITLSEDQKTKISALQAASTKRQGDEARKLVADMKKQPEMLTEVLLLTDALKRGEIKREEFDSAKKALDFPEDAMDLAFDMEHSESAENDPIFVEELLRVLDEVQAKAYNDAIAAQKAGKEAEAADPEKGIKTLEEFEKEITSTRKIVSGAAQLFEGLAGAGGLLKPEGK